MEGLIAQGYCVFTENRKRLLIDACKNRGVDEPEYIVYGEDIMVKFSALQSAKVTDAKALNVTKNVPKDDVIEMKIFAR